LSGVVTARLAVCTVFQKLYETRPAAFSESNNESLSEGNGCCNRLAVNRVDDVKKHETDRSTVCRLKNEICLSGRRAVERRPKGSVYSTMLAVIIMVGINIVDNNNSITTCTTYSELRSAAAL